MHTCVCLPCDLCDSAHRPPTQTSEPFKSPLFFSPSEIAVEGSGPQSAVHRRAALLLREGCPAPTAPLPASRKQDDEVKSPVWPAGGTAWKLANTALSFLQLPGKESSPGRQEQHQPASGQPVHPNLGSKAKRVKPEAER